MDESLVLKCSSMFSKLAALYPAHRRMLTYWICRLASEVYSRNERILRIGARIFCQWREIGAAKSLRQLRATFMRTDCCGTFVAVRFTICAHLRQLKADIWLRYRAQWHMCTVGTWSRARWNLRSHWNLWLSRKARVVPAFVHRTRFTNAT